MANCGTSFAITGISGDCSTSMGGIQKVWITAAKPTVTLDTDGEKISSISKATGTGVDGKFYEYTFKKNTGSMTSTLNIDSANGLNYVSTELVLQFLRMETSKRAEIAALSVNDLWILVLDCNGIYWFLGYDNPVNASAGTGQTGQQKSDGNNYSITLLDESNSWPYEVEVSANTISTLTA